jgi:hypothetical protein
MHSNETVLQTGEIVDGGVLYTTFMNILEVAKNHPEVIPDLQKYSLGQIEAMEFLTLDEQGLSLQLEGRSLFNTLSVNKTIYRACFDSDGVLVNPISSVLESPNPEAPSLKTSFDMILAKLYQTT